MASGLLHRALSMCVDFMILYLSPPCASHIVSLSSGLLDNGILTFQRLLGDFILSDSGATEEGYSVAESGVSFSSFPTFQYEESGFFGDAGGTLQHFMSNAVCSSDTDTAGRKADEFFSLNVFL